MQSNHNTLDHAADFRRRFYEGISDAQWSDWRWQMRHTVRTAEELRVLLKLSADEEEAVRHASGTMPLAITPYYMSLFAAGGPEHPLRRTVVPTCAEDVCRPEERVDPLGEMEHEAVPGLIHTYPDKVLFLVTDACATYCRYCTRSRRAGSAEAGDPAARWAPAVAYIRAHPEVRDILISGGDPLVLGDERLASLLGELRAIPHVEILRLATKVPVVLPQRVTETLARVLREGNPLWVMIHVTHPDELTPEMAAACARLADAGLPLCSQTVLLAGVNDDPSVMKRLMHGLLKLRVRPYYLHQCDLILGAGHFRTPVARGLEIIQSLHGHTTGLAAPTYVIDAPGGGGKVPMLPDYVAGIDGDDLILRNYRGQTYRYHDRP